MTKNNNIDCVQERLLLSRRSILRGIGVSAASTIIPNIVYGQEITPLSLPLKLDALISHIGISVSDVLVSANFYSRLYGGDNVMGESEPFLRYFITFAPGSVAIGKIGTLGSTGMTVPLIDHYCVGAQSFDEGPWQARLSEEGYVAGPSGVFFDHDNIPIQVAGSVGGESLSAGAIVQHEPLYIGEPLVRASGHDHIIMRVTDVDKTAAFYQKMFGYAVDSHSGDITWIRDGDIRIGWRELKTGESPGIDSYGVKTGPFDAEVLSREVLAIGAASVEGFDAEGEIFNFSDPDGIKIGFVQT